jgi:hypothetical protein
MKSRFKAVVAGLFLAGIGGALLFHGRTATAAQASAIPFTFVTVDAGVHVPGAASTMVVRINN